VLAKAGNFAIDLPDADVLVLVSGAFCGPRAMAGARTSSRWSRAIPARRITELVTPLRMNEREEASGMDLSLHGEEGYNFEA
jgi:hypothetical protein